MAMSTLMIVAVTMHSISCIMSAVSVLFWIYYCNGLIKEHKKLTTGDKLCVLWFVFITANQMTYFVPTWIAGFERTNMVEGGVIGADPTLLCKTQSKNIIMKTAVLRILLLRLLFLLDPLHGYNQATTLILIITI